MATQRPKYHSFNGKKYRLVWKKPRGCQGLCDSPNNPAAERQIAVNPKLAPKDLSEVILHEGLHAELWCLDEETVERVAYNLNDLLWKCGFRLDPQKRFKK